MSLGFAAFACRDLSQDAPSSYQTGCRAVPAIFSSKLLNQNFEVWVRSLGENNRQTDKIRLYGRRHTDTHSCRMGSLNVVPPDLSAEACRIPASRFSLQAPHLPARYNLWEGDIGIGQNKSAYISWNPGEFFENQTGCILEAHELQPGLVPSHCFLPSTQNVTVIFCCLKFRKRQ